jgi:threonine dehydrogenase-like Zn-dependent dehydrogenase
MPIRVVNGGTSGVAGVRIIGQHPEAQGSFGELVVVAEALAKSVDAGVSSDAAALTDAFAVGEFYVRAARMEPGEVPVVIGAGAIGLSAVVALAGRDIEPIIVSDYKAERRELACKSFGAHIAVDPAEKSPFDLWRELRAERGLWGSLVVFECVGAAGLIQKIVDSVDIGSRSIAPVGGTPATR